MEHDLLNKKLQYFIKTKPIPNIIFHGETGSCYGEYKKTITKSSKKNFILLLKNTNIEQMYTQKYHVFFL